MKNFSIITTVRLMRLKNGRIPSFRFTKIKMSEIVQAGYSFQKIDGIKPNSCSFTETEKETAAGTHFEKKLQFEISKLRPEVSDLLSRYTNSYQLVAIITDANGYSLLIFPLTRNIKRELPGTAKGANVTNIEFSGKGLYESPFVDIDI